MAFTGKKLALTAIGSALALSFVVFGVLFVRYDRGRDPNNEDKIRDLAQRAEANDNPPLAAHCWLRLMALNPFEQEYRRKYYHALVRVRDFQAFIMQRRLAFRLMHWATILPCVVLANALRLIATVLLVRAFGEVMLNDTWHLAMGWAQTVLAVVLL